MTTVFCVQTIESFSNGFYVYLFSMAIVLPYCQKRQDELEERLLNIADEYPPISYDDPRTVPHVRGVDYKVCF